jgi:adenylate cyclase
VPAVLATQVVLDLLVSLVVAPYLDTIVLVAVLFIAFQAASYAGMAIANSEQIQRRRGDFLQDTFSRYVPASVVGELVGNDMHIELGGQQRDITVLFCDIRGFTSWSENREAQEIITELNTLLSELSNAVISFEGTLDKFTGDGLMAFWGAPLPTDDHAARACQAALEMLERLDRLNAERVRAGQEPFAIGVGVHSGTAVVGNVGHEQRLDYTAIGDTVNLAARLEAATKEIGSVLLVSAATQERLPTGLRSRSMRIGEIAVKGRRQPVEVYALQPRRREFDDIDDPDELPQVA